MSILSLYHQPSAVVEIGNADEGYAAPRVRALTIDLGADVTAGTCAVDLVAMPTGINYLHTVQVALGWNGLTVPVYRGYVYQQQRQAFPSRPRVSAYGQMWLVQRPTLDPTLLAPWPQGAPPPQGLLYGAASPDPALRATNTDQAIAADLLRRAGVRGPLDQIDGAGYVLGTRQAVRLAPGEPPASLLGQLDELTGYWTGDVRDGRVARRRRNTIPSATAAWAFDQGVNVLAAARDGTIENLANAVRVRGIPQSTPDGTASATEAYASAPDPYGYVWDPPGFVVKPYDSDLIETTAMARDVAARLLADVRRVPDAITLTVPGNPFVEPGVTVAVRLPELAIAGWTPYWVRHVTQNWTETRWTTTLRLLGYPAGVTYSAPAAPIVAATFRRTAAGGAWTVTADAGGSLDPSGDPTQLQYAFASNAGSSAVQSGSTWSATFTTAELASAVVVVGVRSGTTTLTASATYTLDGSAL